MMIGGVRLAALPSRTQRGLAVFSVACGAFFSCRQATQITVYLRGDGFACERTSSEPGYAGTGVLARSQLTGAGDLAGPRADGGDDDCKGSSPLDLGSVVLVPQSGPGPVEVLAVAALSPIEGSAPSIDDCVGYYRDFLDGKTDACAPSEPCAACIFARRSLGFVEYSNLDLTISLDNECAGVLCEASKTCVPERGCVSAVVECNGSDCEEPGGVGGAASGAGGSGGSGGENTGGAPPTVGWQLLPVTGGVPH
ncbi:MAG: hypothetical protein JNK04_00010, partial [Myxococcales bacterium]|nr:hypothetical protein [Myxococcales bacterium]